MNRFLAIALVLASSAVGLVGCDQKTEDKTVQSSKGPDGEVKKTTTTTTEKSGDAKD